VVVTLLLDDPSGAPATVAGTDAWRQQFGLENVYVLADAGFSMVPGSSVGTPMQTVVDPRTMTVVFRQEGYSGSYPELEQLAMANKAAAE
jgi:hypothetical protein